MKSQRHLKILEIIAERNVETQEELTRLLREQGFGATQATVSRDIKELRLVKVAAGKNEGDATNYKYAVNPSRDDTDFRLSTKLKSVLSDSITKLDYAGNIAVIRTYAGMASACGAAIDAMNMAEILGSVAGDDTIIVVMRTEDDAREFIKKLSKSVR